MKNRLWCAIILLTTLALTGCGDPGKRVPPPTTQQAGNPGQGTGTGVAPVAPEQPIIEQDLQVALPSIDYVNQRIFEYGRKLGRWKELDSQAAGAQLSPEESQQMVSCFKNLQTVLNGYSDLRAKMLQAQTTPSADRISGGEVLPLQKEDIAFLESPCAIALVDSGEAVAWAQGGAPAEDTQFESLIQLYGSNGDHEKVIQIWLASSEEQRSQVDIRTRVVYGNALMYLHQEEKAAEVYRQAVEQLAASAAQATDLVSMRKVLADLYTASGNYRAAEAEYKKVAEEYLEIGRLDEWSKRQLSLIEGSVGSSPELSEYSTLLRNYLGFIPQQDGYNVVWQAEKFLTTYPYSTVSSNVEIIKEGAARDADNWFNAVLAEAEVLTAEKQFKEALRLLDTLAFDIISTEQQLVVKAKKDELQLAHIVERPDANVVESDGLEDTFNNGMELATAGHYDKAIVVFTGLLNTSYSTRAATKIREVALEAAQIDRKKAAQLFISYTKTTDLAAREKLLIESRNLLKNILVKYPDVEIAPKILGNIKSVESEMNSIDPSMVLRAELERKKTGEFDEVDSAFERPAIN